MHAPPSQPCHDLLQSGLDLLDQGISVFDGELRLVAWNRPFLELLDFPADFAVIGRPFADFIRYNAERGEYGPGDCAKQIDERIAAARSFSAHVSERRRPNGSLLLLRGEPLPNGGFVTLYSDITEQRYLEDLSEHQNQQLDERVRRRTAQLENANAQLRRANAENSDIAAALSRSESRLRLINDTMPMLIAYLDQGQIYRYVNKGYAQWFAHPASEIIGRSVAEVVGGDIHRQVNDALHRALAGERVSYEYRMTRGEQHWHAHSTLVPELGADGKVLGVFVFSHDITEQKRMQAALLQAQKMEAIGSLTGGLAHDFNNLLTVIIGNLAALEEQQAANAAISDFVTPALQSARRGVQLIRRLLTYSRQQPLEPAAVDINHLLLDLARLIRRSLPDNINLSTPSDSHDLFALADPALLESALLNFALNARDAMPGGGHLQISAENVELPAEAPETAEFDVPPGHYISIAVADDGCGMSPQVLAHACEPFFTTKRLGLGSGLGLAMAQGFVRQSGGGMRIRSEPERGTQVEIVLPQTSAPSRAGLAHSGSAPHADGALVLLVEDDSAVRRVVRQQLIELGHPVIEAENAEQALAMVEQISDIAIVVSDVLMPGNLNGRQLSERIRHNRPHMRIVLVSGYADDTPRAGDPPVLAKPFSRQDLARALAHSAQTAHEGQPHE
ncbi:PAS-domain containing protein [Azonexus sp.]|uniref:PAS-domain containing protein n=1 Tax=Azonexus sp. TaxID=1872668 RepID=UPI0039E64C43